MFIAQILKAFYRVVVIVKIANTDIAEVIEIIRIILIIITTCTAYIICCSGNLQSRNVQLKRVKCAPRSA